MKRVTDTLDTDERERTEAAALQAIILIASNHGCTVDEIDMERHVINLSGPKENEHECAVAIGNYMEEVNNMAAKEKARKFEQNLTGCGEDCAC